MFRLHSARGEELACAPGIVRTLVRERTRALDPATALLPKKTCACLASAPLARPGVALEEQGLA